MLLSNLERQDIYNNFICFIAKLQGFIRIEETDFEPKEEYCRKHKK